MNTKAESTVTPADRVLELVRDYDAPRALVFATWTQREHLLRWWAPRDKEGRDFTTPYCDIDVRPGGRYRIVIRGPSGNDNIMRGEYREVVDNERLVFTFAWEDENGEPGHENLITVTFEDIDGRTRVTFHQEPFESVEQRDSHAHGWGEVLDRLRGYLPQIGHG